MNENDLLKYVEGRLSCIEARLSKMEALMEPITIAIEMHNKLFNQMNSVFCDVHNRCESIESAMEKIIEILQEHDDMHESYNE
jgi:hypothetical protein